MRKHFMLAFLSFLCFGLVVSAQNDADLNTARNNDRLSKRMFKANNPLEDKTDMFEVTGVGGTVFTTSNTSDGTANSYKHSQKITLSLAVLNGKSNSFQLVFFSPDNEIPYSASFADGSLSIYFPISMYEEVKQKLDQSLAARKKVQLKVIQKKDGYREGTLIL